MSDWLNELEGEGRDNNKANPDVIFHLLKAINGNTESLGYVIDQIREDESNIYQFLGHLVDSNVETRDAKVLNEKVIKWFFTKLLKSINVSEDECEKFIKKNMHMNIQGLITGDGSLYRDYDTEDDPSVKLKAKTFYDIFHDFYINHKIDLDQFFELFNFDLNEVKISIKADEFGSKKIGEIERLLNPPIECIVTSSS